MALKKKIDKETYEKLSKDLKENYTASGEGYILDLDGDDSAELKRAKDRESADNIELRKQLKELGDKIKSLEADPEADPAREKDIEKLTRAFDKKLEKLAAENAAAIKEREDRLIARDAQTKRSMINAAAMEIAAKISNAPKVMAKLIAERFDVDFEGDVPELIILGENGKRSHLTTEQLTKEFVRNKDYSTMIIGSRASGSADSSEPPRKPSRASDSGENAPDLSRMPFKDLATMLKERKESQSNR